MKGHKSSILIVLLLIVIVNFSYTQTITLTTENSSKPIKFARHYADNIFLLREIQPNDFGKYVIYNDSLLSGLYYLIMSDSNSFEILYDADYPGKISINQNREKNVFYLESAPPITVKYNEFQAINRSIDKERNAVKMDLRQNDLKSKEKRELENRKAQLQGKSDSLLNATTQQYKESVLGSMLRTQIKIEVPEYAPDKNVVNKDSATWAWRTNYYKKHYLDNFNITDKRLLYTPVYTATLNKFFDKIIGQEPQELCKNIDFVLNKVAGVDEVEEFVSDYLLNKYNRLKNDANYEVAYLHIIETYYLKTGAKWLSNSDISKLSTEYNKRKPLAIGQIAPNISLTNSPVDLYTINHEHIIVYFFNYDCEHCITVTKELKKLSVKLDSTEVGIYAVCLGPDDAECNRYITSNDLSKWHCSYNAEEGNKVAIDYNLSYTPTLYLLDKDKRILSKNITTNQLKKLLEDI